MKFVYGLLVLAALPAFGALPPYHQRMSEINAILDHADLEDLVTTTPGSSGVVDGLEYFKKGPDGPVYLLRSGKCQGKVAVDYIDSGKIGPQEFEVRLQPLNCPRIRIKK